MQLKEKVFLVAIFIFAFALRVYYLPSNTLTFGYDQGRDAFESMAIAAGDLKVLGPPASTPGLFHGVFYYYILSPVFLFTKNPIFEAYWIAFLNSLAVFIVFLLAKKLSGKSLAGFLGALLFAVSFESVQYATWLSNPTLGVWTVPLMYLGLWLWLTEQKTYGAVLAALGLGLSIQSEIFLAYHSIPLLLWLYIGKKEVRKKDLATFTGALAASLSTMLLAEIKFGFKGIGAIPQLVTGGDSIVQQKKLSDFILLFIDQIGKTFSNNLLPINVGYGAAIGVVLLFLAWKVRGTSKKIPAGKFIATYVLAHITVVTVGGVSTPFLLVGIGSGIAVMAALALSNFSENQKYLVSAIVLIMLFANVYTNITKNKHGSVIFSIQTDMLLSLQLQTVDETYRLSKGEDFSINTVTSPLWVNSTWSYLYNWYGLEKYGYLPRWHGRDQVGRLGNNLSGDNSGIKYYYLILEPFQGIPPKFIDDTRAAEDAILGEAIYKKEFSQIVLEQRIVNHE